MNTNIQVLNPKKILIDAGLSGSESVADFGCGPGIFTIPASELTNGIVYAFDIQESVLEVLTNQIRIHNIPNIKINRVNLEVIGGSKLEDKSVSFVIMRKILLQNDRKDILLKEAYRVLRDNGVLIVVGWTEKALIGPKISDRIKQEKLISLAKEAGFYVKKQLLEDDNHYAIMFSKKN